MNKFYIYKQTRKIAADTLYRALDYTLNTRKKISEVAFRDLWLNELRKHKDIFDDGWYLPPTHGIAVLFASTAHPKRADFVNLRPEKFWPRNDIYLDKKTGYTYLYASPTDRKTGVIGDIAINIYFGENNKIKNHLKVSVDIEKQIFKYTKQGMTFSDIFNFADSLITKKGLRNNIVSITNPDGVNIGHTIPASYENWNKKELKILKNANSDWTTFKDLISNKRRFLSRSERLKIVPGMGFTLEPALKNIADDTIPMTMFHQAAFFKKDGKKELLTNFDKIFKLCGMDYML